MPISALLTGWFDGLPTVESPSESITAIFVEARDRRRGRQGADLRHSRPVVRVPGRRERREAREADAEVARRLAVRAEDVPVVRGGDGVLDVPDAVAGQVRSRRHEGLARDGRAQVERRRLRS